MRIPRIYIPQDLAAGNTLSIDGPPAHHVKNVLRLRTGAELQVFDGKGNEYMASLQDIGRAEIKLTISTPVTITAEPALDITLAQGIARNDRMDLILQKAVELGVNTIQPLWMQRSQKHLTGDRLDKRRQHWQGVVVSACEQCGRAMLPVIQDPVDYRNWATMQTDDCLRLMLQPDSEFTLQDLGPPGGNIVLLVGPEGGMNSEEQLQATGSGFRGIRLGQHILRTETAALAALSGMQILWGDFS